MLDLSAVSRMRSCSARTHQWVSHDDALDCSREDEIDSLGQLPPRRVSVIGLEWAHNLGLETRYIERRHLRARVQRRRRESESGRVFTT